MASKHAMRHTAETSDLETKYQNLLVLLPIKLCALPQGPTRRSSRSRVLVTLWTLTNQWLVLSYRSIRCNDKAGSLLLSRSRRRWPDRPKAPARNANVLANEKSGLKGYGCVSSSLCTDVRKDGGRGGAEAHFIRNLSPPLDPTHAGTAREAPTSLARCLSPPSATVLGRPRLGELSRPEAGEPARWWS
jgi:hypothetical protein